MARSDNDLQSNFANNAQHHRHLITQIKQAITRLNHETAERNQALDDIYQAITQASTLSNNRRQDLYHLTISTLLKVDKHHLAEAISNILTQEHNFLPTGFANSVKAARAAQEYRGVISFLERYPRNQSALKVVLDHIRKDRNPHVAKAALQEIVEIPNISTIAALPETLGYISFKTSDYASAVTFFEQRKEAPNPPAAIYEYLDKAYRLNEPKNWDAIKNNLDQAHAAFPQHIYIVNKLSQFYAYNGDKDKAREIIAPILNTEHNNAETLHIHSKLFPEHAGTILKDALDGNLKEHPRLTADLIQHYKVVGSRENGKEKAMGLAWNAIRGGYANATAFHMLATIYDKLSQIHQSIDHLEQASQIADMGLKIYPRAKKLRTLSQYLHTELSNTANPATHTDSDKVNTVAYTPL